MLPLLPLILHPSSRNAVQPTLCARLGKPFNWPSNTKPICPDGDWFLQDDFYNHGWNAFYAICAESGDHKYPGYNHLV